MLPRLFLVFLITGFSTTAYATDPLKYPCLEFLSVSLVNGTRLEDGSIDYDGLTFPPHVQFNLDNGELRGCPCLLTTCIRTCCEPGEYHDKICHKFKDNSTNIILPPIPDGILDPSIKSLEESFYVVHHTGCLTPSRAGLYVSGKLKFPTETFSIGINGCMRMERVDEDNSIVIDTYDPERYCIAWSEKQQSTKFVVCDTIEKSRSDREDEIMRWCQTAINFLSVICCLLTLGIYLMFPTLRNVHGKTLMCYIMCLAVAYTVLPIIKHNEFQTALYNRACEAIAYIVHFSFLASFFWLNVMCFDIWWTFGGFRSLHGSPKQRERKKFIMYSIYAWGCASMLTIVCMIMDLVPGIPRSIIRPEFGEGSCWFKRTAAKAIYFYGPMGVTVLCNICLFILTALKILRHKKDTAHQLKGSDSKRHDDNKQWFNLYLKLFIVMGINWSMEIISWLCENQLPKYVWFITDLTNTLQGVIIFIIFVWKDKIKRLLMKRFGCTGTNFLSRNSTRSGCATSSTSRTTCVTTAAPLQEKVNPYADSYRGKTVAVTDESDCV